MNSLVLSLFFVKSLMNHLSKTNNLFVQLKGIRNSPLAPPNAFAGRFFTSRSYRPRLFYVESKLVVEPLNVT